MGTAQLAFEGVLAEVIACAITTGSYITGYDVTVNEREMFFPVFPAVFFQTSSRF
jgi:hypothetical protein